MLPILFSIGGVHVASFSVFLIFAWLVWSFVFWKMLRTQAVEEERIFDLTFYATLLAIVGGRAGYVLTHWDQFSGDWLATVALWVAPGLSLYGALIAGLLVLVYLARRYNVRLGHVLDGLAFAFPAAVAVGEIGALLDGSTVGLPTRLPWAVSLVGIVGKRHPVPVYELVFLVVILVALSFLAGRAEQKKWAYGVLGIWFFLLFSTAMFVLEFFKESPVYWRLRANQWVLVAIFAETLGAFYVRGGGREVMRPIIARIRQRIRHGIGELYGRISKRRAGNHTTTS
ncbi:prolipoprotein diacylglyceryl transferase [Candidatus Gottesmanbacteria bacterium]|nr:prolipoprotein diacylglyceryl transferase [Candidatus Gottesmanbacteria bacterium]